MADLSTEIREAFDKEQSAFPPPPAIRHEVVDALVARQKGGAVGGGGQPNFQWVAVAAAILITVAVDQQTCVWAWNEKVPGHAVRQVAVIARDQGIGQTGISLAACSVPNDVAILVRTTISWVAEVWVVKLSDGRVIAHHTYTASMFDSVIASPDGKYIAENSSIFTSSHSPHAALLNQIPGRYVTLW